MEIRDAEAGDVASITAIYNAHLGTTTHEWIEEPHTDREVDAWRSARQASGLPFLAATDGAEVVGFATYGDFRDSARWPGYRFTVEHSVHVAEAHWGRGTGRALLDGLADRARAAGKRVMVAGIDGANQGSIEFHVRLGFAEVGRLPGIGDKWGQRLDLVLMQRDV
jgi:phosphinothricin acetyltransferase